MEAPTTIGVAGAGTMGAGIAQLGCVSGALTLLHDPDEDALARAVEQISGRLKREVQRGRLTDAQAAAAHERLAPAPALADLADCELVIEAAPESLEIKQRLLATLADAVVSTNCVLATNTSSLLVTALAAAVQAPERVVGMHFFNPAPVMAALELVAGVASSERALALARAAGEAMGKIVIDAADGPGFLVNRCNRPFGGEALKLLAERVAEIEQIDRICRLGGGFRMGPFELMDLVGVDVGLAVQRSMFEQGFGEPRWRPSPIAVRTVAAGHLGRKTGRGYYDYRNGGDGAGTDAATRSHRAADPEPLPRGGGEGRLVVIAGESVLARELADLAYEAGWEVTTPASATELEAPFLILDACSRGEAPEAPLQGGPRAVSCSSGSLAMLDEGGTAIGFHALAPLDAVRLVELTRGPDSAPAAAHAAEAFFGTLGMHAIWVGDAPGLVLGRIVCQLVNEAAFALGEGVGDARDIDAGVVHALNYPRGILRWADAIGLDVVLGVLDALYDELREERYRPAPALTRLVWSGRLGESTGEGFFNHDEEDR